jgi:hypothetical protein
MEVTMKRILLALSLSLLALPSSSFAVDKTGHLAIGYFNPDAPLGIRYPITPKVALDVGVGFAQAEIGDDPTTAAAGDEKKNMEFHIEAGIPLTIMDRENVNLFFRPGVLFRFIPTYNRATVADPYEKKSESETAISLILGAEWFPTGDLSLSVGTGLEIESSKGVDANDLTTGDLDSSSSINGLQALDITRIGFHFYF